MEQKIMEGNMGIKLNEILIHLEFLPKPENPCSLGLEHPSVEKVIQIALELTKENKLITSELLYNRAKKELRIPKRGLKAIIQLLLNKKILSEGSRFTKMTVLMNKTRASLFWLVNTYPGAHFSFLKTKLAQIKQNGIGVGHLNWHLEMLIKFDLIKKVKVMNFTIFLPIGITEEEGVFYFILRDDLNRKILEFLIDHESVRKSDINQGLHVKRGNIYYRIKKLRELGIILAVSNGEKYISLNSERKDLLVEILNSISCIN
ncbi:MAG: winged helix-turn-helix transcriptional regulator [Promethearchaeota archaeon]